MDPLALVLTPEERDALGQKLETAIALIEGNQIYNGALLIHEVIADLHRGKGEKPAPDQIIIYPGALIGLTRALNHALEGNVKNDDNLQVFRNVANIIRAWEPEPPAAA